MTRRFRLRSASRPTVLGLLATAALLATLVLTGLSLNRGSGRPSASPARIATISTQPPYRLGGKVECPPNWPVLAMSNHRSYPAGHPTKPPATATALACYHTPAQAATAGYAPAPLPAGALEVGGVYLTPTSRRFRARCQQVADRLGFAVPCPGLLPTSAPGTAPRLCDQSWTCRPRQLLVLAQDGFVVPFGFAGAPGGYGILSIIATPARGSTGRPDPQCPSQRPIATPTVHRIPAVLAACPQDAPWVLGGSVQLRWSERGTLVVISTPGSDGVHQRLVAALAEHLRLIGPSTGRSDLASWPRPALPRSDSRQGA